ncbi:MAG: ABC transporter substrate-binding protein [Firmicutes bacterium]|nr:ABC transporter substrate-binding protein [Bacillota bacterium]
MMKKTQALLLCLALLCVSACAMADVPARDRAGNAIAVPQTVQTIVSLAPSITRVIVDLGMGDRLVAVDMYSVGIEGLPEDLPALDAMAPDAERLIALMPDIVLASGMSLVGEGDALNMLTDLGVCVAYIPSSNSIAGIMDDILFIGQAVGNEEGSLALCDAMTAAIDALRAEASEPVPVYFEIGSMPALYSFGSDTFLDEMITLLGGRNIFGDKQGWLSVADESVIALSPAIIFTNEDWNPNAVQDIISRPGWESVDAVTKGKVFLIDGNASSQPNHRIVLALEEMAKAFDNNAIR